MSTRTSALTGSSSSSPFDIKRTPLSIRTLDKRRTAGSVADRVRREFAEMRGFSPTLAQAAKLFDLPADECDRILRSLVQDGSLRRDQDGRYRLV